MIKIENCEVVGWEHAIRGMRNPMNSWEKSDSVFSCVDDRCTSCHYVPDLSKTEDENGLVHCDKTCLNLGNDDLTLMKSLANAGDDHGKVIRYLDVYVDITAPLYFWKEFRTYRKGRQFMDDGDDFLDPDALEMHIETNSCSTMHKIHSKEFELDDFSHEHLMNFDEDHYGNAWFPKEVLELIIKSLNQQRKYFLETKDKKYWWQMIQLLPSSYNQKRTVKLNYQVLKNMYHARKNHKLDEWREFCKWIESLPYSEVITGGTENV